MAETFIPEGKLDTSAAVGFHAALLAHVGQDIVIDLHKVTQIGALCCQLFLAAARTARSSHAGFSVINVTDPVLVQLASMGLTPETLAEGKT
ncbi:STAS domain-containing protein [Sulfitobacter sp. F26204]|uniref:STAS domain-containing protein n=1 Tax=Sulfitobacter sp. F26204 TaxID=2996014 RepID=UPI00225E1DFE|nr:STAS domain-containing protein [Sulfitobacter sp. F26204]MCX7559768.1 STAS domain-containing protein [Sulfitobacter sp. F26204]